MLAHSTNSACAEEAAHNSPSPRRQKELSAPKLVDLCRGIVQVMFLRGQEGSSSERQRERAHAKVRASRSEGKERAARPSLEMRVSV